MMEIIELSAGQAARLDCRLDVDSVVFAATSLLAFGVLPKIVVRTSGSVKPSENAKLCEQLRSRLPQRSDGRQHHFFEFRLGGYGEQTIRVLFQYAEQTTDFLLPDVYDEFASIMRTAIADLPADSDCFNYGASTSGGRRGARSFTIFSREWATFAGAVDRLLPTIKSARNFVFYRAVHGILCPLDDLAGLIQLCRVVTDSPHLLVTQLHLGVRVTPPEGCGLFVKKTAALATHRASGSRPRDVTFYHPGFLGLGFGHYRCYGTLSTEARATFCQAYCPAIHKIRERVACGVLFMRELFAAYRHDSDATASYRQQAVMSEAVKHQWKDYLEVFCGRAELRLEVVLTDRTPLQIVADYVDSPVALNHPLLRELLPRGGVVMVSGWAEYAASVTARHLKILLNDAQAPQPPLARIYDAETLLDYFIFGDVARVDYRRLKLLMRANTRAKSDGGAPVLEMKEEEDAARLGPCLQLQIRAKARSPVFKNAAIVAFHYARRTPGNREDYFEKVMNVAGTFARRYYGFPEHRTLREPRQAFRLTNINSAMIKHKGSHRCTISDHMVTDGELADKFLHPTTTAGCLFRSMLRVEDLTAAKTHLVGVLRAWHVEVFPLAMLDKGFTSSRNTWHKVTSASEALKQPVSLFDSPTVVRLKHLHEARRKRKLANEARSRNLPNKK